jgi:hypothetical protein
MTESSKSIERALMKSLLSIYNDNEDKTINDISTERIM